MRQHHLIPVRMVIKVTRSVGENVVKCKPLCTVSENVYYSATLENNMEVLQKIENGTTT